MRDWGQIHTATKIYAPTEDKLIDDYRVERAKDIAYSGPSIYEHINGTYRSCIHCRNAPKKIKQERGCCRKFFCAPCNLCRYVCSTCCDEGQLEDDKRTPISVRPGYGLVITVDDDIYAASLGPARINLCCEKGKRLYWVDTAEKTIPVKGFKICDKDSNTTTVDFLLIYRVTDVVNYVFNLYKLKDVQKRKPQPLRGLLSLWAYGAKAMEPWREIERD